MLGGNVCVAVDAGQKQNRRSEHGDPGLKLVNELLEVDLRARDERCRYQPVEDQ
jgi:hypothetical protein